MALTLDLDRFRTEWLSSLAGRREQDSAVNGDDNGTNGGTDADRFFFDTIDRQSLESVSFCRQLVQNLKSAREQDRLQAALRIYEIAVSEETRGSLADSLKLYRLALRIHDNVDREYGIQINSRLHITNGEHKHDHSGPHHPLSPRKHTPIDDLISQFSSISVTAEFEATDLGPAPFSLFTHLPNELVLRVLKVVALSDLSTFVTLAQVCKSFAYIVAREEGIWRRIAEGPEFGFSAMHHQFVCSIKGHKLLNPRILGDKTDDILLHLPDDIPSHHRLEQIPPRLLPELGYQLYQEMLRFRPRVRFNGIYISRVNYTRQGQASSMQVSWSTPVQIVSYFRFLRFYRDGTVITLLTHEHPSVVIPVFHRKQIPTREEWNKQRTHRDRVTAHATHRVQHGHAPGNQTGGHFLVSLKNGGSDSIPETESSTCNTLGLTLRGRWRLSDPQTEDENDIHIETESSAPGYRNRIQLGFGKERVHSGAEGSKGKERGRNIRVMEWKGFWYCNVTTQEWSEFSMSQMKSFVFSRVKSYKNGLEGVNVPI